MGKNTKLKEETLHRIRKVISEHGGIRKYSREKLVENDKYLSIHDMYMNSYEKSIADDVLDMIYDGKSNDEIRLLVRETKLSEGNVTILDDCENIENETEAMFIKSQGKVVEGPIVVDVDCRDIDDDASNKDVSVNSENDESVANAKDDKKQKTSKDKKNSNDSSNNITACTISMVGKLIGGIVDKSQSDKKPTNKKTDKKEAPIFVISKNQVIDGKLKVKKTKTEEPTKNGWDKFRSEEYFKRVSGE